MPDIYFFWSINASRKDESLGRLVNDDHLHPNCKMKKMVVKGKPHLFLFALRDICAREEITYNYGGTDFLGENGYVKYKVLPIMVYHEMNAIYCLVCVVLLFIFILICHTCGFFRGEVSRCPPLSLAYLYVQGAGCWGIAATPKSGTDASCEFLTVTKLFKSIYDRWIIK